MCKHVCLFLKFYYEHPSKRIYINQMKGCIALWGEITQSLNHNQLLGTSASRKIIHCSRPIHGFWLLVELVLKEILYNGYCLQFESFAIQYINGSIFYSAIPISTVAFYLYTCIFHGCKFCGCFICTKGGQLQKMSIIQHL